MSDAGRLTCREMATKVFGERMIREIWSHNYEKVLPISVDFDLTATLPAIFYMFRFGHRRGTGQFLNTFGPSEGTLSYRRRNTTAQSVASKLASAHDCTIVGFKGDVENAILGDLLLCYCLENRGYELGRSKPIQRVAPAHYMASWIDLPNLVVHLRNVPETIVAILAGQKKTEQVRQSADSGKCTWFPVVKGREDDIFAENVLLKAFSQGMQRRSTVGNLSGDCFKEDEEVGLDQLLTIRLAQALEKAPAALRGGGGAAIPNRRPIAFGASRAFSEDIRKFVRAYAPRMPRQAFVEMLESCMAVGLTSIVAGVVEVTLAWPATGVVVDASPSPVFVDSSAGTDPELRSVAEQSMDDYLRKLERLPVVLMALRMLDYRTRLHSAVQKRLQRGELSWSPSAKDWIDYLGAVLHGQCSESRRILDGFEINAEELAEEKYQNGDADVAEELRRDDVQPNPVWRLAEALTSGQGPKVHSAFRKLVESSLHIDRPNGLATKRRVRRAPTGSSGRQSRVVRSIVFTDAVLEYLVHRHVLPSGSGRKIRRVSFGDFIDTLRKRYGFCVDQAPPGMKISNTVLQANRSCLERRLRDLGLLVGVNDAEAMKRLRPRFGAGHS